MTRKLKFSVGQRVWRFDENRRVYTKPDKGRVWGDLIYAEHYEPAYVLGIKPRVYLIGYEPKDDRPKAVSYAIAERRYATDAEKDDQVYRADNAVPISEAVRLADVPTLKRVAELIGYEPRKQVPR